MTGGNRAFIVGAGIVSPMGTGMAETAQALERADRGIRPLSLFPASSKGPLPVGEVVGFAASGEMPRTHALALSAAREAMADHLAGPVDAIVLGVTTGGMPQAEQLLKEDNRDPDRYVHYGAGTVADYLAGQLGCSGPVITVSTACSSGAVALKVALELIRQGRARRVLAGGVDALCRLTYYGFGMLQLIDPEGTRPLDVDRKGMTVAEGAAMLLLMAAAVPPRTALAELLGAGLSCDAYHPSAPHPEGNGALAAMKEALSDAGISPDEVDYVNLHGTGTRDNDVAEARAVLNVFAEDPPPLSSTKGSFGHSLAAAGAVEAVVCMLALRQGLLPATVGCTRPDPDIGLSPLLTPTSAQVAVVMSNSLGFGGNNASVVFARADEKREAQQPRRPMPLAALGSACVTGVGHTEESIRAFLDGRSLQGVLPDSDVTRGLPPRSLRRLKRLPRMTLALAAAAHSAAGGTCTPGAVFLGTGWGPLSETQGFLKRLFDTNEEFSSPTDFVGSVHNALAGQAAMWFGATGANVTTTGGDYSFEQALLLASLLATEDGGPILLMGVDEAHPELTPLLDASARRDSLLSDGGGALLVRPTADPSETTLRCLFFAGGQPQRRVVDSLVDTLGGGAAVNRAVGVVFAGIPAASKGLAQEQLQTFLSRVGFSGRVIDYRQLTGQYASASATAAVLAVDMLQRGPATNSADAATTSLGDRGILLLGLGEKITAVEVRRQLS